MFSASGRTRGSSPTASSAVPAPAVDSTPVSVRAAWPAARANAARSGLDKLNIRMESAGDDGGSAPRARRSKNGPRPARRFQNDGLSAARECIREAVFGEPAGALAARPVLAAPNGRGVISGDGGKDDAALDAASDPVPEAVLEPANNTSATVAGASPSGAMRGSTGHPFSSTSWFGERGTRKPVLMRSTSAAGDLVDRRRGDSATP